MNTPRLAFIAAVALIPIGCETSQQWMDLSGYPASPQLATRPDNAPIQVVVLPTGEKIEVVPLTDGDDALVVQCGNDPWVSKFPDHRYADEDEGARRAKLAVKAVRDACLLEANRICRLHLWGRSGMFALLHEAYGPKRARRLFVRCIDRELAEELRQEKRAEELKQ
jgi:hypothetical protein